MGKNIYDLTSLGNLVLDTFAKPIDAFPSKGALLNFDTMESHPGGCAFNTGVGASRLGLKVSVQGKVGYDQFGDIVINALNKENINTEAICRTNKESTGFSFVMVPPDGQRRIYHTLGANASYCLAEVSKKLIKQSKVLHIAGASLLPALDGVPMAGLFKWAQKNGVITSMDPSFNEESLQIIIPSLPHLDLFLPNTDESVFITGYSDPEDQLKFYLDHGVGICGIKMGENGALISDGKQKFRIGIFPVNVEDTCGAGDSFIAGFIYGLIAGWDLYKTAKFATATASFCVQSIGTTNGIPKAEEVLAFLNNKSI